MTHRDGLIEDLMAQDFKASPRCNLMPRLPPAASIPSSAVQKGARIPE